MDKVIAVSNKMRDTLRSLGVPDEKLVVIHNAIVVADYPACVRSESVLERHSLRGRTPILGCIGRLSREKGQDILCEAIVKLSEKIPSACLLLIGSGPEQGVLQEKYRRYSDRIIFVGHVTNVRDYLSVIDLHVLPSLTEGLPNVVLEAACMGIPTVATAVGGTPECVVDGETGILVPPGDSTQLTEAILRVVSDDELKKTLGLNAARYVTEQFSFEHRVAKITSLYDGLFEDTLTVQSDFVS
jgi:glycosyltransferase involved in cell wall biosynthesis